MSADAAAKHASLVEALAAAQGEFEAVARNRVGQEGNRKFKYVDLSAILAAVTPALSRHGIAHTTRFETEPAGGTVLVSELHHGTETLASRLPVAVTGVSIMQAGKNITYLRRYALQALLDVCPDEEDQDGDDLGDARQPPARQQERRPPPPREPSGVQRAAPAAVQPHDPETGEVRQPAPPARTHVATQARTQERPEPSEDERGARTYVLNGRRYRADDWIVQADEVARAMEPGKLAAFLESTKAVRNEIYKNEPEARARCRALSEDIHGRALGAAASEGVAQ